MPPFSFVHRRLATRVAVLCVLLAGMSAAPEAQKDERRLFSLRDESGKTTEWVVSGTRFCATKKWDAEKGSEPPLAVTAAVRAAINASKPRRRWIVTAIGLESGTCIEEVRWYYSITLYDEADIVSGNIEFVTRVVLMDGLVVLPRPGKE